MHPRIEILQEKKLIGQKLKMSLLNNRTYVLWSSFMPRRKEIINNVSTGLFSMQVYNGELDFNNYDYKMEFDKWAAVEVEDFNSIPFGMDSYIIKGGLYAVFNYIGLASEGEKTFQYIFTKWLPASEYLLDDREHFEILGAKYKNNDPDSEEEIWIPIKRKQ